MILDSAANPVPNQALTEQEIQWEGQGEEEKITEEVSQIHWEEVAKSAHISITFLPSDYGFCDIWANQGLNRSNMWKYHRGW